MTTTAPWQVRPTGDSRFPFQVWRTTASGSEMPFLRCQSAEDAWALVFGMLWLGYTYRMQEQHHAA